MKDETAYSLIALSRLKEEAERIDEGEWYELDMFKSMFLTDLRMFLWSNERKATEFVAITDDARNNSIFMLKKNKKQELITLIEVEIL